MTSHRGPDITLFYSYCHTDTRYKESMEKTMSLLRKQQNLLDWSDTAILPGQSISTKVRQKIDSSQIMAFLLSSDFIDSEECMKEWTLAKKREDRGDFLFRIPIIIRTCPWKDLLKGDDIKALPEDGRAISQFSDSDIGWQQVYDGIKRVLKELRSNFRPNRLFVEELHRTEFLGRKNLKLSDIFVFPRLVFYEHKSTTSTHTRKTIASTQALADLRRALIHGHEKTGKSTLAKHLFLSLVEHGTPVIYVDMSQRRIRKPEEYIAFEYGQQFLGDYELWSKKPNKCVIVDNPGSSADTLTFLKYVNEAFEKVFLTMSTDIFYAFYMDEGVLSDYKQLTLQPMSSSQQEELIRKRLALSDIAESVTDGFVDQVEDRINSIVISNRIVPRYPFYVLSILQTYESYMPTGISITSYGHCYYVLVVASLVRTGIADSEDDINSAFNFCEHLAFALRRGSGGEDRRSFSLENFMESYKSRFFVRSSILNRIRSHEFGIVKKDGTFKYEYMRYFFLARFLSRHKDEQAGLIEEVCANSHKEENHVTLLFLIHHTSDLALIEDILVRTMCTLDKVPPAVLNREETRRFDDLLQSLPEDILAQETVEVERSRQREIKDEAEELKEYTEGEISDEKLGSLGLDIYRVLKNNKLLGQLLRSKHGDIEKVKIKDIVEIVGDAGLRLINSLCVDEKELAALMRFLIKRYPNWSEEKIRQAVEFSSLFWIVQNLEQIVHVLNVSDIRSAVAELVETNNTPAYDLIGYFGMLDRAQKLTDDHRRSLQLLWNKHEDKFVRRVLSWRTQDYLNTHSNSAKVEQAICSILQVKYVPRMTRC